MNALSPASVEERYLKAFASAENALAGADVPWLRDYRRRALAYFKTVGFPIRSRQEDWKYTDVSPIAKRECNLALRGDGTETESRLSALRLPGCHELVFINGHHNAKLSPPGALPAGLTIRDIASLLKENAKQLSDHLSRRDTKHANAFSALNDAFLNDGAYLRITRDTVVDQPIHLLFVTDRPGLVSFPRIILDADTNSRVKVIETYVALGDAQVFTNTLTEILAAENSVIEHYRVQEENLQSYHVAHLSIDQGRNSEVISHSASFGAVLARNDIWADLNDEGAAITLNGIYVVAGRQHVDFHTQVRHNTPQTRSEENFKGILNGRGRGVFNGKVMVQRDAQKTVAHQSNKNLLLSKNAEVDTKPELQIYADDVICTHGATVGQLDEDALFYLRSRGIADQAARGFLTYAFAADVIGEIAIEAIRTRLQALLLGHLPDAALIKDFV